jgi:glucose-1-phosphate thymidylyltransferase
MMSPSGLSSEYIGLIPMAGLGKRVAPLPCSKEIFPIGFYKRNNDGRVLPKTACAYLLEKMHRAGARKTYIIIRSGKWDIPNYLGDGESVGMKLAYLTMRNSYGAPFTLDQAYPFVKESLVFFGFPDIIFSPSDAFIQLRNYHLTSKADIVLGVFPATNHRIMDMVARDETGIVQQISIKPAHTELKYTWLIAVWGPTFTDFMHDFVAASDPVNGKELFVGHVIQAAIDANLRVESVLFDTTEYIDIGNPENLFEAVKMFSIREET